MIFCKFCRTEHTDVSHWFRCNAHPWSIYAYIKGEYGRAEAIAHCLMPMALVVVAFLSFAYPPPVWYWAIYVGYLGTWVAFFLMRRTELIERWHLYEDEPVDYVVSSHPT